MTASLNMDFALTEEQEALVEALRGILESRMTLEHLARARRRRRVVRPRHAGRSSAKADLLGVTLPEVARRPRLRLPRACLLLQEVGRTVAPVPFLHTAVSGALPIAEFGTPRPAGPVAAGRRRRQRRPHRRAERERGRAGGADDRARPATATAGGSTARRRPSPSRTSPRRCWCRPRPTTATSACSSSRPTRAGVSLDRQNVVNHEPQFEVTFSSTRRAELLGDDLARGGRRGGADRRAHPVGLCAVAAGVADKALRITAEYSTKRKQFDRAIATFQAVGQRMADAYIDTEAIKLTMLHAATRLAEGKPAELEVATGEVLGVGRRQPGRSRRAARPRRHQHRPRLPDPPLLPLGQGHRVHARLGHPPARAGSAASSPPSPPDPVLVRIGPGIRDDT